MNRKQRIDAITLNDIIQRKLEGIINKVDIASQTTADEQLERQVRKVLRHQKEISGILATSRGSHASQ
jgi:hypothetical protein